MVVLDILIILAFLGLIVALIAIVNAALSLKRDVAANMKRITERPTRSAKNLANTGKGILLREQNRVQGAVATVKATAEVVKVTVDDTRVAVSTLRDIDWAPAMEAAQTGMKFAAAMASVAKAAKGQGAQK